MNQEQSTFGFHLRNLGFISKTRLLREVSRIRKSFGFCKFFGGAFLSLAKDYALILTASRLPARHHRTSAHLAAKPAFLEPVMLKFSDNTDSS
ncbi:hypothetical protein [Microcoleus sp. FACHB-68]|uniref:hypothetical protein n=1 Tax=Microcoleus sp. FACHB-68 TaxID=2692826 RepID=UPI001686EB75|nr:hypothetical protein [Microcoleus sp. FACHB-68]MBD1939073.1 hypothetical protein [Microcoleus sp. FACHB-68]